MTRQGEFAAAVLDGCRAEGIHTAIETSGACPWPRLSKLAARADLVLYDIKLIDDAQHRKYVGVSNRRVLDNARRLAGRNVQIRVPLIPGITDTEENLGGIFAFMRDAGLTRVALLPYNPASGAKYEWLGLSYDIQGAPQEASYLAGLVDIAARAGLEATVG